jgi:hypothetical protein
MASHAGWTETVPYSNTTRLAATFPATATSKAIAITAAVFNINANATVGGCFLCTDSTKSGTAGILCGVGNFTSGDKSVSTNGTLTVNVSATAS